MPETVGTHVFASDDFIARTDAHGAERDCDRIRAGRDADRMLRPAVRCEFALERLDRLAEHEATGVQHIADGAVQLRAQALDLAAEIEERHVHSASSQ